MLLGSGADPNVTDACGETAALTALRDNNLLSYEVTVEHGGRLNFPIPEMLMSISVEDLKAKLRKDPDLLGWKGIDDWSLLHWATNLNRLDLVETLLEVGLQNDPAEKEGLLPIHVAARNGFLELVDLLVQSGVHVDHLTEGWWNTGRTPLHVAAFANENAEVVHYLTSRGASVDVVSNPGCTPLHEAARNGNVEIVKALIEHGADKNMKTRYGKTTREIAEDYGHDHLALIL